MTFTDEGVNWTPFSGLRHGLPTIGVVTPSQDLGQSSVDIYDAIVIGAGYSGLVATRDLTTQGKKTLLLEARDRLGGRTWNATINGSNYEMGGTWIHWHMPHIYREVSLYGLHNDWVVTQNPGSREDYCTITSGNFQRNVTHHVEDSIVGRVFQKFSNLDGEDISQAWKYPFGTGQSPDLMNKWDQMSCQDRVDQIQSGLTLEELGVLKAFLLQMGGNSLQHMGLLDALRWWTLGSHKPTGLNSIALHTRLASGNSELHQRIFRHAVSTGNLHYRFKTPVSSLEEDVSGIVTITTRDGLCFKAKAVILTVPLNTVANIKFSPPLSPEKQAAAAEGSVNFCNKVHLDINGPDYLSWSSLGTSAKGMIAAFGDNLTCANNSHLVAFGPDPKSPEGISLDNIEDVKEAVLHLLPSEKRNTAIVNRIVYHDWNNDEFSRGAWCFLPPKFVTRFLSALQEPHGNVYFASGDWSDGWRGWIDGAVHIGTQAAYEVIKAQSQPADKGIPPKATHLTNGHG